MPVPMCRKSCIAIKHFLINQCIMEFLLLNRSFCFVAFIFLFALDTALELGFVVVFRLSSFGLAVGFVGVILIYMFSLCANRVLPRFCCLTVS
jgi:hypothetical protein